MLMAVQKQGRAVWEEGLRAPDLRPQFRFYLKLKRAAVYKGFEQQPRNSFLK